MNLKLMKMIVGPSGLDRKTKPPVARMPTVRAPVRLVGGIPMEESSSKNKLLKKSKESFKSPLTPFKRNPLS